MLVAIGSRRLQAHYIERRRECVGLFGGGRNYDGGQDLLGRPAAARIDDVAVPFSLIMKKLGSRAAGSKCLIEEDELRQSHIGLERMAEGDGPARNDFGFWILDFGLRSGTF